jgi:hypothetical protein
MQRRVKLQSSAPEAGFANILKKGGKRMRRYSKPARVFLITAALIATTGLARGQSLGIRAGQYTDIEEFFIGVELLSRVSNNFFFNPNVEYVFVENGNYMTFNLDLHYDFYTSSPLFVWLGAGLGLLYNNPEGPARSDTDLGVNLLFGLGLRTESALTPYLQGKFILADRDGGRNGDNNEFVLAIGLRF